MDNLIILIATLFICYMTGTIVEKRHYKKIKTRELILYKSPCISYGKSFLKDTKIKHSFLVSSSVVIGCDRFKSFLANLRNIFGGNVSSYESVLDRGRREAILRIREEAAEKNANAVINLKLETTMLGSSQDPQVCVTAYGTAVCYA